MNSSFCILGAVDLIAVLVGLFIFPQPKNKWVEQAKVLGDAESQFGRAMAINGNIAAIASPGDGTVHIYTQSGNWSLQASLSVPPTQPGSYSFFGSSVAIDGNTVLVAADSLNCADSNTPLYVFTRTSESWFLQAQLQLPSPPQVPIYYQSVAIALDVAVASTKGTVYIFRRHSSTGWSYEAQLNNPTDFYFGDTVAIDGNTIVVSGGDRRCASAYIYVHDSVTGTWLLQAELTPRRRDVSTSNAVAISGNTVVIGIPGENLQQGAVYVFERHIATGEWVQQTRLVPRDVPPFFAYGFGASVAIDGNAIVVGASTKSLTNMSAYTWQGGAYVYVRAPVKGGWSQPAKLLPQSPAQVTQTYAEVVSICGDRIMVTAGEPNNTVYFFKRVNS